MQNLSKFPADFSSSINNSADFCDLGSILKLISGHELTASKKVGILCIPLILYLHNSS